MFGRTLATTRIRLAENETRPHSLLFCSTSPLLLYSSTIVSMSNFVARYKPEWDELEMLVRRARGWFRPLSADERTRLDELYRRTTTHLARVSTRTQDQQLVEYLNNLTAAAHSVIYLPPQSSVLRQIGQFAAIYAGQFLLSQVQLIEFSQSLSELTVHLFLFHAPFPVTTQLRGIIHARLRAQTEQILHRRNRVDGHR